MATPFTGELEEHNVSMIEDYTSIDHMAHEVHTGHECYGIECNGKRFLELEEQF